MTGPELVALRPMAMAAGGEAIARDASGGWCSSGARCPASGCGRGDRGAAQVRACRRRARWSSRAPARVEPPCPYVAAGCGGCDLQHAAPAEQRALKRQSSRRPARLGGIAGAASSTVPPLPTVGFRTTVRVAVTDGRAGFRQARTTRGRPGRQLHGRPPRLEELLADGRFPGPPRSRCALRGDRRAAGPRAPRRRRGCCPRARATPLREPDAWITEEVAGRPLRISARSFFQTRTDGAAALVDRRRRPPATTSARGRSSTPTPVSVCSPPACPVTGRVVAIEPLGLVVPPTPRSTWRTGTATIVRVDVDRWRPEPAGAGGRRSAPERPRRGRGRPAGRDRRRPHRPRQLRSRRRSAGTWRCWPATASGTSSRRSSTCSRRPRTWRWCRVCPGVSACRG